MCGRDAYRMSKFTRVAQYRSDRRAKPTRKRITPKAAQVSCSVHLATKGLTGATITPTQWRRRARSRAQIRPHGEFRRSGCRRPPREANRSPPPPTLHHQLLHCEARTSVHLIFLRARKATSGAWATSGGNGTGRALRGPRQWEKGLDIRPYSNNYSSMTDNEFRLDSAACRAHLTRRLAEPAPGRLQLLTGPRQVGKTTLLLELAKLNGPIAVYASCDGPEAALPVFWERLWTQATEIAQSQRKAILLLDEVQHVTDWAARLG